MSEWRVVIGLSDYEVSCDGVVRRATDCHSWKAGKILKPLINNKGYELLILRRNKKQKTMLIHRMVAMAFLPPQPTPEHIVAHGDGDRRNNRYTNLRWATNKENESDKAIHGTKVVGERCRHSKLTAKDVVSIRERYSAGNITHMQLGAEYGVYPDSIGKVIRGDTWKHLSRSVA